MNSRFLFVAPVALLALALSAGVKAEIDSPAPAATAPSLPSGAKSGTKLELDALRTRTALAAEQAKALGSAVGGQPGGPMVPPIAAQPIPVSSGRGGSGNSSSVSARVTMVAGAEGKLAATIQTARGLVVARVGDRLPDLGTVQSITANQVMVENGKRILSLPFAAEPASSLIQGGSIPAMPGNIANQPYGVP